jgi:predicted transcriptional regulator
VTVLLTTGFLQGLWWLILGYFVYSLARAHRADADAKAALSGLSVADVMTTDLVTAPADISIADFLTNYLTPHPHALIPLQDKGAYIGAVGLRQVKAVPRTQWETTPIGAIAIPLADIPAIGADVAVEDALEQMQSARAMRLLVRSEGHVLGVLAMSDIMAHVKFRNELAAA